MQKRLCFQAYLFPLLTCFFLLFSYGVFAETDLNMAKSLQNPIGVNPEARHITLPFMNYTNFDYGDKRQTQDILDVKPVVPLPLTPAFDLFIRTIIPFMHQPNHQNYANGLGDINPVFFIAPSENRTILWGVGPSLTLPTATNRALGAGKWSLGPELVLIAMPDRWTLGILTSNIWSVAGQSNRPAVNQFSFQYYITYNFLHGWYVTTQPTITANWMATSSQQWTVPFGVGAGRFFRLGNQPINLSLQFYDNAIKPTSGARWTLQANLEFLFPDPRTV